MALFIYKDIKFWVEWQEKKMKKWQRYNSQKEDAFKWDLPEIYLLQKPETFLPFLHLKMETARVLFTEMFLK